LGGGKENGGMCPTMLKRERRRWSKKREGVDHKGKIWGWALFPRGGKKIAPRAEAVGGDILQKEVSSVRQHEGAEGGKNKPGPDESSHKVTGKKPRNPPRTTVSKSP